MQHVIAGLLCNPQLLSPLRQWAQQFGDIGLAAETIRTIAERGIYHKKPTPFLLLLPHTAARGIPKSVRSCTVKFYVHIAVRIPLRLLGSKNPLQLSHLASTVECVGGGVVGIEVHIPRIQGGRHRETQHPACTKVWEEITSAKIAN